MGRILYNNRKSQVLEVKMKEINPLFRITKDRRTKTWVVARTDLPHEHHTHFKDLNGCFKLIHLFEKGIKPNHPYLKEAMLRITTPEEWDGFREENKGC